MRLRSLLPFAFAVPALLLPGGCASHRPTLYLTLSPVGGSEGRDGGPASSTGLPLAVAPVEIPPEIDRAGFTTATGASTLAVAGKARWAAPLAGMIQTVLAHDLAGQLTGISVLMPGDPVPAGGVRSVRVNVIRFLPDSNGQVALEADWSVMAPDGHAAGAAHPFHTEVLGGRTPADQAEAMSQALGRLAEAIARGLD